MNEDSKNSKLPRPQPHTRPRIERPPIQWPSRTHEMGEDAKRAAKIARTHVERAHTVNAAQQHAKSATEAQQPSAPQSSNNVTQEEPFDWHTYHQAWQQYYHRYFYQYYRSWWIQQSPTLLKSSPPQPPTTAELQNNIRTKIAARAKKTTQSTHFRPALAALTVGLVFLLVNYNQVLVGAIKQYVAPGSVVTTPVIIEANSGGKVSKDPLIIIPKIGVEVPVVYDEPKVDEASYQKALERGVVRLGKTANPGTIGNVVIGGHSSNNVFNAGDYKYVFVNLKRLNVGDVFYLNYEGQRYTYKVTVAKKIIGPKDVSVLAPTKKPTVTLFTCDPPGTNINRLIVQAEQVDPDPNAAPANQDTSDIDPENPLPSVAPSLWDKLTSFFD